MSGFVGLRPDATPTTGVTTSDPDTVIRAMTPLPGNQLTLSPIEQQFAAAGVTSLPQGAGDLTARELKFVTRLLEHGQMGRAAREAGYSATSAGAIATETLHKPKVMRFYRECLSAVVAKADQLTRRVYERSVMLHAKAVEAAQTRSNAEEWIIREETQQNGKDAKTIKYFERTRDRAQRDEKHYATLANQTDTLLAALLGKIKELTIDNSQHHNHVILTPNFLAELSEARRQVVVPMPDGRASQN